MSRWDADRLEGALERATQGGAVEERLLPLVQTAQRATIILAGPPPPPPHQLAPGRQRFLAEAARIRTQRARQPQGRAWTSGVLRLGTALVAVLLFFGLVFGAGHAVAASVPGDVLYGLDLKMEALRLALTTDPLARADVSRTVAEERLDEIATLLERGQRVEDTALDRVEQQLAATLEAAAQLEGATTARALLQLETAIQQRQQTMIAAMEGLPQSEQVAVRQIVQVMERVRLEARAGQADPDGLRQHLRYGAPPEPTTPPGPSRTPQPSPSQEQADPHSTDRPGTGSAFTPSPTGEPGSPEPTALPAGEPSAGPQPASTSPRQSTGEPAGPPPTQKPGTGSGPEPSRTPAGPDPTHQPVQDPGPQPTQTTGSSPTGQPDSGSDPHPQPPEEPGGPEQEDQPGPGPQPAGEPGGTSPSEQPGPGPEPEGEHSDRGQGKP